VLLVRRAHEPWKGHWDVPGGFCGEVEHPADTAEREVREETGLPIVVTGFLGIWLDEYATVDEPHKRTLNIYYHAELSNAASAMCLSDELTEAKFFDVNDLPAAIAFPGHVPAALDAWKRALTSGRTTTPLPDRSRA
jgi:8-oxo-dGTP diphosphatase